jgi:taurine dioxygenase
MTMRNSTVDVRPAFGALGGEIRGVDLAQPMEERTYREIRNALNDYGVIFIKDQGHITPAQQLAFGKRFGEIWISKSMGRVPGHPEVIELRKDPEDTHDHGGDWHTDQQYTEVPPLGSILLAREIPSSGGGDTMFANMHRAYETLSEGLKKTLLGLRAVHTVSKRVARVGINEKQLRHTGMDEAKEPVKPTEGDFIRQASHPVVTRHPETGRKVLYISPTYTTRFEGWTVEESAPLLKYLFEHSSRPDNICRFHWSVGDIAFWDNRSTWHFAVQDYNGYRRVMHRVSVVGSAPVGAS